MKGHNITLHLFQSSFYIYFQILNCEGNNDIGNVQIKTKTKGINIKLLHTIVMTILNQIRQDI